MWFCGASLINEFSASIFLFNFCITIIFGLTTAIENNIKPFFLPCSPDLPALCLVYCCVVPVVTWCSASIFLFNFLYHHCFWLDHGRTSAVSSHYTHFSLCAPQIQLLCAQCIVVWLHMWFCGASQINERAASFFLFKILYHHCFWLDHGRTSAVSSNCAPLFSQDCPFCVWCIVVWFCVCFGGMNLKHWRFCLPFMCNFSQFSSLLAQWCWYKHDNHKENKVISSLIFTTHHLHCSLTFPLIYLYLKENFSSGLVPQ